MCAEEKFQFVCKINSHQNYIMISPLFIRRILRVHISFGYDSIVGDTTYANPTCKIGLSVYTPFRMAECLPMLARTTAFSPFKFCTQFHLDRLSSSLFVPLSRRRDYSSRLNVLLCETKWICSLYLNSK